jgi:hypothetical protein
VRVAWLERPNQPIQHPADFVDARLWVLVLVHRAEREPPREFQLHVDFSL